MANEEPIYGLTDSQHREVGRLVRDARNTVRPATGLQAGTVKYPGLGRVILIDDEDPTYSPRTARTVGIFRHNPAGIQITVEFTGQDLEGDVVLTLGDADYQIPCDCTTEELRAILGLNLKDCRATVFPAYWEFDFNNGQWSDAAPAFSMDAYEPDDPDEPVFDGGIIITDEGWVSMTDDGDTYLTIDLYDWVPYITGAVKRGAIGLVAWSHEAGWLPISWQCRDFSFAGDSY